MWAGASDADGGGLHGRLLVAPAAGPAAGRAANHAHGLSLEPERRRAPLARAGADREGSLYARRPRCADDLLGRSATRGNLRVPPSRWHGPLAPAGAREHWHRRGLRVPP